MNEYTLIAPPNCAGVYALRNKTTKQLYIGSTVNLTQRLGEWRLTARNRRMARSDRLNTIFGETPAADWVFIVLAEMPNAATDDLRAAEQRAIDRAVEKSGDLVLNTQLGEPKKSIAKKDGDTRLTRITYQGRELTYREAAEILGVTRVAVKTRLAKLRAKGTNEVSIEQLFKKRTA